MGVDYYEYIQSAEWRQRANEAKRRAGYRCRVCNRSSSQVTLDAHHRTYDRLGHEDPDDITVLCRDCHELFETNPRISRPARRQKQSTTYQTTLAAQSYSVNQNTSSKELVLPTLSSSDSDKPWKIFIVVGGGAWLVILIVWLSTLFSPVPGNITPTPILIATDKRQDVVVAHTSTLAPVPPTATSSVTFNPLSEPDGSPDVGTITKNVEFRNGPGMGRPILGTLVQGRTVIIAGYVLCDRVVWYHVAKYGWIMGEFVDSASINVPYHNIDCLDSPQAIATEIPQQNSSLVTVLPVPTKRSPTPTSEPVLSVADCAGGCIEYPSWCAPPIKGNVSYDTGEKIYHVPGQEY